MAIDPICGMTVDEATGLRAQRNGQTYYFCCDLCRQKFLAGPPQPQLVQILGSQVKPADLPHATSAVPPTAAKYICPMCAGVASDKQGSCPKCGMALEPAFPVSVERKAVYTCPMHPEIEQDHPGACPKCGMDLEPRM